jgi:hypothetical protein
MNRIDPTLTIERLARRLRRAGAAHPVAGAVAQAARGASCLSLPQFSVLMDVSRQSVAMAEQGEVPFGELAPCIGRAAASTGADLLALADLELEWRAVAPEAVSGS